jgi:class 3 adenylate cyclase/predicted ATPase
MQQIAQWLDKLGMSEYLPKFTENRVDFSVLRDLTDQDLKDLGVLLGDRRKLLRAIGKLDAAPLPTPEIPVTPAAQDGAERRQLTLMFCDLVGSTTLSTRFDPEDIREIIGAYHRCCAKLVEDNGGFVAKYMGDGVLVYFGYPHAHEHDAERAVQVGLALVEAVPKLVTSAGLPLQVRVGIATGLVVVGDLLGSGEAQERGVVGETPNLAARLQGVAAPGMVVIADATRRLVGNLFELQDLGPQDLKGIARPVQTWAALRASSAGSRFEALHATSMIALVGREEESALLLRRWSSATAGEGQVVLLSGEAGIGKSRLMAGLLERLAAEPHTRLRYFCSPQHTNSSFYPIIGQIERNAGLTRDDTPHAKLDKVDAMLAQTSTCRQDSALFSEMLALPNDGRYPALDLTPQQRRQKTLDALVVQIEALAHSNPVLMLFEDAHWSDPTSLEVLGRVVDRIGSLGVLLIVTFRPEFEPPWIGRPHVTSLSIGQLAPRDIGAMIDRIVGNKVLPANIRRDIIERTDGIPLFVEEMTKAVLEAEGETEAQRTVAAAPPQGVAVPASLHASLMARLDRLGSAKEVAQIGASIGREFSHSLLASVVRKPQAELEAALDRLIVAGLLFRHGVPPRAMYLFNHALVQDAAYSTLLRERRRAIHTRIVETLESQFTEIAESQPELLARHSTEAGLIEKAAGLWGSAGQRSLARSALIEAADQLAKALGQFATLPGTAALRRQQIKLQVALINTLFHVKGYAAPETKAAAEQARLLIEQAEGLGEPPEDPLLLFSVLYGFWVANYVKFDGDVMLELASQFLALAEKQATTAALLMANRVVGISLLCTGNFARSRTHFDRAIALYDPVEHRPLATRFGQDVRVVVLCYRSWPLWMLGHPEAALADSMTALRDARELEQASTLMNSLFITSLTHICCGNYVAAKMQADELVTLANEKGAVFWKTAGTLFQGCVSVLTGNPSDAIRLISSGITAWRATGSTMWVPLYLTHLAKAHAAFGQFDDAWRCMSEAMTTIETTRETWYEAEVNRTAGDIALLSPQHDAAKAEAYFERALSVARKQKARSFELRTATSLARLWREQGKRQQARDLLAPVYDWFTEGFNTYDLTEAKALLDTPAF